MISQRTYVVARVALARAYCQSSESRYLDAYHDLKQAFLAQVMDAPYSDAEPMPALLRPQAGPIHD